MILRGLIRTDFVVCDSAATRDDLLQLGGPAMADKSGVVLLAQNHPYQRLSENETAERLATHKTFEGGRPSSMYILDRLEPQSLGALIALYEHRTAFSGALAGINPFDQWGVELGKELASSILKQWDQDVSDPVTNALLKRLKS